MTHRKIGGWVVTEKEDILYKGRTKRQKHMTIDFMSRCVLNYATQMVKQIVTREIRPWLQYALNIKETVCFTVILI